VNEPLSQVYVFDMLTAQVCRDLIIELENYEKCAKDFDLPLRRPNSMNNYGLVLNEIGFRKVLNEFIRIYVTPLLQLYFPQYAKDINHHHSFVVKYAVKEDELLDTHIDSSLVTLNVCLGKEFKSGSLYFHGIKGDVGSERGDYVRPHKPQCDRCKLDYNHRPGVAVIHLGKHVHGANRISSGERVNLIIWMQRREGGQIYEAETSA